MLCKNVDQEAIKPWLTSVAWSMPASQVVNFMIAYAEFVFLINFNDKTQAATIITTEVSNKQSRLCYVFKSGLEHLHIIIMFSSI